MTHARTINRARARRLLIEGGKLLPFISTLTRQQRKGDLFCKNNLLSLRFVNLRTAYFYFINLCAN